LGKKFCPAGLKSGKKKNRTCRAESHFYPRELRGAAWSGAERGTACCGARAAKRRAADGWARAQKMPKIASYF